MATTTAKHGLTKPASTDFYDITEYNENLDKIDNFYSPDNKPTATDVGALPISGGTLTADKLGLANNGWVGVGTDSNSREVFIQTQFGATLRRILLRDTTHVTSGNKESALRFYDGGTQYNLFGEHNKPSGTYVGNGSETARSPIPVNGIGHCVAIIGNNGTMAILTKMGAICRTGTSAVALSDVAISYKDGNINIATNNPSVNASGTTYSWYLL